MSTWSHQILSAVVLFALVQLAHSLCGDTVVEPGIGEQCDDGGGPKTYNFGFEAGSTEGWVTSPGLNFGAGDRNDPFFTNNGWTFNEGNYAAKILWAAGKYFSLLRLLSTFNESILFR